MGTPANPRPRFLHIPEADAGLWAEFEAVFAADCGPKYVAELLGGQGQWFHFFMDVDGVGVLDQTDLGRVEAQLVRLARNVHGLTRGAAVTVTWCPDHPRMGAHIHTNFVIKGGVVEAEKLASAAAADTSCVVDCGVYVPGNGLRMFGSEKVSTSLAPMGRLYTFFGLIAESSGTTAEAPIVKECPPLTDLLAMTRLHIVTS
jgi:hypothetical protein